MTKDQIRSIVGLGFHEMLRRGIDGHGAGELWTYVQGLPEEYWTELLDRWIIDRLFGELKEGETGECYGRAASLTPLLLVAAGLLDEMSSLAKWGDDQAEAERVAKDLRAAVEKLRA